MIIDVLHFSGLGRDVLHGVAGRRGGVSEAPFASLNLSVKTGDNPACVDENRRRFERSLGIESRQVACGRLRHGNDVAVFALGGLLPPLLSPSLGWPLFEADAAISNIPGLALVMTFADCVPIMLWDAEHEACGLAHAGWRGTALRIGSTAVSAMRRAFSSDPKALRAAIGPSIGQSCYPVGEETANAIGTGYPKVRRALFDGANLDLWKANRSDLLAAGLEDGNIQVCGICTSCHVDRFFSHRVAGGPTGRFGACIGVRGAGRLGDSRCGA